MMRRFLLCGLLLTLGMTSAVEARVYLDINAPSFIQVPIVLSRWGALNRTSPAVTEKIYEALSQNFTLSGFFKVIDYRQLPPSLQRKEGIPSAVFLQEWTSAGGEMLLAGEAATSADSLHLQVRFHLFDLVEQKYLVGKQYDGPIQGLRHMVHRIADEVILQLTGERGVHTSKIAYTLVQGPGKELFVSDFDGGDIRQITRNQSINVSPVWAPDGRQIAFTSYLKRNPDLYLIDLNGTNLQRLSARPGLNLSPAWSPDGKHIALMMGIDGKAEIVLVDPQGRHPRVLTKSHGNEASPSWSPDGKSIAFVSDRSGSPQVYIMANDGSGVRRLTYEGNYNTNPAWSPKGDRIAYCGRVGGRFEIFTIRPDGTGLQNLSGNAGNGENPCWSPDGRYIAFSSTRSGGSKIYIMHMNGLNPRPLTASKGGEASPSWSRRFE